MVLCTASLQCPTSAAKTTLDCSLSTTTAIPVCLLPGSTLIAAGSTSPPSRSFRMRVNGERTYTAALPPFSSFRARAAWHGISGCLAWSTTNTCCILLSSLSLAGRSRCISACAGKGLLAKVIEWFVVNDTGLLPFDLFNRSPQGPGLEKHPGVPIEFARNVALCRAEAGKHWATESPRLSAWGCLHAFAVNHRSIYTICNCALANTF